MSSSNSGKLEIDQIRELSLTLYATGRFSSREDAMRAAREEDARMKRRLAERAGQPRPGPGNVVTVGVVDLSTIFP